MGRTQLQDAVPMTLGQVRGGHVRLRALSLVSPRTVFYSWNFSDTCLFVSLALGQEFNSFASTIAADLGFLEQVSQRFYTCNMGGTAIGTGIAATTGYSRACVRHLRCAATAQ
jgi:aspartate ammonia-lyase